MVRVPLGDSEIRVRAARVAETMSRSCGEIWTTEITRRSIDMPNLAMARLWTSLTTCFAGFSAAAMTCTSVIVDPWLTTRAASIESRRERLSSSSLKFTGMSRSVAVRPQRRWILGRILASSRAW